MYKKDFDSFNITLLNLYFQNNIIIMKEILSEKNNNNNNNERNRNNKKWRESRLIQMC
jgi:hypothetical protein